MWKQLEWQRRQSAYSKPMGEDRLYPDAPFPITSTTSVSDTVVPAVPQVHNSDSIDTSSPVRTSDPVRDLNNFLQEVRAPKDLAPLLEFASVQAGPGHQAVHAGTYACEPFSYQFELPTPDTNF